MSTFKHTSNNYHKLVSRGHQVRLAVTRCSASGAPQASAAYGPCQTSCHAPEDSGVFVDQRYSRFLPTHAGLELLQPLAEPVAAFGCRVDCGLGSLNQQGAQVVVAAFGYIAEAGFTAAGILAGHQT